jgi:hypothetical protein
MSNKKSTAVAVAEVKGSKGRPTVAGSARQARLAAREARVAAGGEVKRGRPAVQTSARQAKLAAQAARVAAGGVIKRGRPAIKKVDEVAAEVAA